MSGLVYAKDVIDLINGLESLPWEEETEYLVNALTTVDAVEVVRCKDCKWIQVCHNTYEYKGRNGYCSRGEREETT